MAWVVFLGMWGLHFVAFALGNHSMELMTKPVPMLALMALVWRLQSGEGTYGRWILIGFVFSLMGDVALMVQGEGPTAPKILFLAGLSFFLVAHLCYIAAFSQGDVALRPLRLIPFAIFAVTMVYLLTPSLGPMLVPVFVYITVISTMVWRAAARVGHRGENSTAQWWGLVGALSFMASDGMIAWERFMSGVPHERYAIMSTYWLGQMGIALSVNRATRPHPAAPAVERES